MTSKKVTRCLLNKILSQVDVMTEDELASIKANMKYLSVGQDCDHNNLLVPDYWAEVNQGTFTGGYNMYSKFDTIDEEQFHMWNDFINRIEELSNDVWRKTHAHKSR